MRQNLDCRKDSIRGSQATSKQSHYKAADPSTVGSAFNNAQWALQLSLQQFLPPPKSYFTLSLGPFSTVFLKLIIDELASKQKNWWHQEGTLPEQCAWQRCLLLRHVHWLLSTSFGPRWTPPRGLRTLILSFVRTSLFFKGIPLDSNFNLLCTLYLHWQIRQPHVAIQCKFKLIKMKQNEKPRLVAALASWG